MKKLSEYIVWTSFLLLLLSCEDTRLEGMMDDKVYLVNPGLQDAPIFNFGEYDFDVFVYKSGYGTKYASLKIAITSEILETYNIENGTDYQLLPEDCFSLQSTEIGIPAKTSSVSFPVSFNSTRLKALQEDGKNYILPLSVIALNDVQVDPEMGIVLLNPLVKEPYIAFAYPGLSSMNRITLSDPEEFSMKTSVSTNYKNKWDITFEMEISHEALDAYNLANETSYKIFPEKAVSLNNGIWAVPAGTSMVEVPYTIIRKNLMTEDGVYMFGEYVVPFKISSVSKYGIDPDNSAQFIRYSYLPELLDRSTWQVIDYNSCISQEPNHSGLSRGPEKILDGDKTTFWGSKWDAPSPMPYYFIIDMQSAKTIFRLGLTEPAEGWRGNIKTGYFEISDDQQTWTRIVDWELPYDETTANREHLIDNVPASGRYLKLVITEAFGYAGSGTESGARMDLAELNAWGL